MKKKILALCLIVVLAATAIIGGTLAYFTDTDEAENVFTTGNVDIELEEVFNEKTAKLIPGVDIQKAVSVTNTGSEAAYVRIHLAIPTMLDSGNPDFDASANRLHWNFDGDSVQDGQWTQFPHTNGGDNKSYPNWPGNGGEYNFYQTRVDGVDYNVYVITYESVLEADETTETNAIEKVYLDTEVTQEQLATWTEALGGEIKVLVFAEGGQAATFTDACVALNTQFGDPMAEDYVSPWNR